MTRYEVYYTVGGLVEWFQVVEARDRDEAVRMASERVDEEYPKLSKQDKVLRGVWETNV